MKLYLLSQKEKTGYDTYDSMVVAAENENQAVRTCPMGGYEWSVVNHCWMREYKNGNKQREVLDVWCNDVDNIDIEYLGEAKPLTKAGVICASFNAG